MIRFASFEFYLAFYRIQAERQRIEGMVGRQRGASAIDAPYREHLIAIIDDMQKQSFAAGLPSSNQQIVHAAIHLRNPLSDHSFSAIAVRLGVVESAIRYDLGRRIFVAVNPAYSDYVDNDSLFGPSVFEKFPSASYDVKEAGNCLAAECFTASVFHLMRVAEFGLRALAYDRRVRLRKGPLDLATWEDIIKKLEESEREILAYPKTRAREAQYAFYHGAMLEFSRFKNIFRNPVMHTRGSFGRNDADAIFEHVKTFMQILASKISERRRTAKIWRRA